MDTCTNSKITMSKTLIIVESPGKIKKIGEYLGKNYLVKASYGHCRDLNPKNLFGCI